MASLSNLSHGKRSTTHPGIRKSSTLIGHISRWFTEKEWKVDTGCCRYRLFASSRRSESRSVFDSGRLRSCTRSCSEHAEGAQGDKLGNYFKFYKDAIERKDGSGVYRAIASDASGSHGRNPTAIIWDEIWNQPNYDLWEALTLSPARKHPFHFITTYAGYHARTGNLCWDQYQRGVTGSDPHQYTFWRAGPDANLASWITPAYLESQRLCLPDHIYRRLHMNEWSVAESAKAFRIPAECWDGSFEEAIPGASYVVGFDLAKTRDFTAWCVLCTDVQPMRMVDIGKLPHMDHTHQVELLDALIKRFGNSRAIVDAGAAGAAVVELMRKREWQVEEMIFTNDSKARIVTDLAVGFEQRQVVLPQRGRTLDEDRAIADLELELFNFEPTVLRSGNIRCAAAGAYHDDIVMALCLAWSGKQMQYEPWVEVIPLSIEYRPFEGWCERGWHKL